ncbi:MAG: DUF2808 domain-containing protein [Leptolyngbya sp. SIO1E4]|nr:DUF2808 domain-containing protein [Leptolyngbya sp. SIO1E4]
MRIKHWLRQSLLGALAVSGLAIAGSTAIAQTTEGLTIFGGIDAEHRLSYFIDYNERRSTRARYYLRIAGRKIPQEVLELQIAYPEAFEENGGYFTNATVEVREGTGRGGAAIATDEIVFNTEDNLIEIYPEDPLPANSSIVVVISSVRNPNRYGNHFFTLDVLYQGGVIREFVGIWPLEVAAERPGDV